MSAEPTCSAARSTVNRAAAAAASPGALESFAKQLLCSRESGIDVLLRAGPAA
jgi:hypothetical protein